jgi:hypothetical protein
MAREKAVPEGAAFSHFLDVRRRPGAVRDRLDQPAVRGTAGPADKGSAARRVTDPCKKEMAKKLEQELLG